MIHLLRRIRRWINQLRTLGVPVDLPYYEQDSQQPVLNPFQRYVEATRERQIHQG